MYSFRYASLVSLFFWYVVQCKECVCFKSIMFTYSLRFLLLSNVKVLLFLEALPNYPHSQNIHHSLVAQMVKNPPAMRET